ncbi:MAG: type II toxin-antitoxin system VapC family toxin [Cyanobacteria bacterium REEB67]|nr:type II toxin-antitoxin system VapC family toxin [Cyanobacteria bacterium REEB67]
MPKVTNKAAQEKAEAILFDTHAAIWLAQGNPKIRKSLPALQSAHEAKSLFISAISAWEIGMLVNKGRLVLPQSPMMWFNELTANFNLQVLNVDAQVAVQSSFLPGVFHGDPADRMIVATAQKYNLILLTADKAIISYSKSGVIKVHGL